MIVVAYIHLVCQAFVWLVNLGGLLLDPWMHGFLLWHALSWGLMPYVAITWPAAVWVIWRQMQVSSPGWRWAILCSSSIVPAYLIGFVPEFFWASYGL